MKTLCNRYFILLVLSGLLVYLGQRVGIVFPFLIRNYFNDLLILPIVLWTVLAFLRQFKGKEVTISWTIALTLATYYSLFFEWYLPKFHPRYTADIYDVLCYFIGACAFVALQPKITAKVQP